MATLLLDDRRREPDPGERSPVLDQFRSELNQLRTDVEALRRDNLGPRQQAGYWKGMHARALERLYLRGKALAVGNSPLRVALSQNRIAFTQNRIAGVG